MATTATGVRGANQSADLQFTITVTTNDAPASRRHEQTVSGRGPDLVKPLATAISAGEQGASPDFVLTANDNACRFLAVAGRRVATGS